MIMVHSGPYSKTCLDHMQQPYHPQRHPSRSRPMVCRHSRTTTTKHQSNHPTALVTYPTKTTTLNDHLQFLHVAYFSPQAPHSCWPYLTTNSPHGKASLQPMSTATSTPPLPQPKAILTKNERINGPPKQATQQFPSQNQNKTTCHLCRHH